MIRKQSSKLHTTSAKYAKMSKSTKAKYNNQHNIMNYSVLQRFTNY